MLIRISKAATDFIKGLPPKQAKQVAMKVFALAADAYPADHIRMKGKLGDCLRVDIGEFRIVYEVSGETIVIETIGKRNDDEVYRRAGRK